MIMQPTGPQGELMGHGHPERPSARLGDLASNTGMGWMGLAGESGGLCGGLPIVMELRSFSMGTHGWGCPL